MSDQWKKLQPDPYLAFPMLAVVALTAANNANFMFDPPGFLDAFVFVGYFWHYPAHLPLFDQYYKISRLPWILPAFVAHQLAGDVTGSYLLHAGCLMAGAAALYLLVRDSLRDRAVATIAAVAWSCCTWVHGNSGGGWNYQIVAAGSYYLWACWFALRAARGLKPWIPAFFAGAALSLACHTHLFFVAFTPLILGLYAAARSEWRRSDIRPALTSGVLAAIGALLSTGILAAINKGTGGEWLFFMPQVQYTLSLSQSGNPLWKDNPAIWLATASYLVFPALSLVAATLAAWRYTWTGAGRFAIVFAIGGWMATAIMCYFQFATRQTLLDWSYMAFPLYCFAFPALAGSLWRSREFGEERRGPAWVVTVAAAIILLPLLFLMPALLPNLIQTATVTLRFTSLPPVAGPLIVGTIAAAIMSLLGARASVVAFAVWFSVINVWIAPRPNSYGIRTPGIQRDMLRLYHEADRFTTDIDPSLVGIKYWFQSETIQTVTGPTDIANVFHSFVATRRWLDNLLANKGPALPLAALKFEDLEQGRCLGVLSTPKSAEGLRTQLQHHFAELGHPLYDVARRRFQRPTLEFELSVFTFAAPSAQSGVRRNGVRPLPCSAS